MQIRRKTTEVFHTGAIEIATAFRIWLLISAIVALSLLAGCSAIREQEESRAPEGLAAAKAYAADDETYPEATPARRVRVAILLSDDVAAYRAIADQISRRSEYHDYLTLNLAGQATPTAAATAKFERFNPDKVVAIGLLAAKVARAVSDRPMVFCQVFNYREHDLITSRSKGVKFLPPFTLQMEVWKEVNPDLRAVGVIAGPNQQDLLTEIGQAAALHQVELLVRTVTTDKEALFAFKQLTPQIQGFWVLPDNRVLSPRVLREMLSYSSKYGNQTAVFDRQLLTHGADISFTSRESDIADAVLSVIGGTGSENVLFGPPMTPLTTLRAAVDPDWYAALRARGSTPDYLERYPSDH